MLMGAPTSKITAQGQISVPADVRRKLGVGPGSTLEWVEEGGKIIVKRAGALSLRELHEIAFPDGPPAKAADVKEGVRSYMRQRHARD